MLNKLKENKKSIVLIVATMLIGLLYSFGFYETNKDKSN